VPPPLQAEMLARLRDRYERGGLSIAAIAKEEGLPKGTVVYRLKRAGTEMRPSRQGVLLRNLGKYRTVATPEIRAEVRRLYELGETTEDISAIIGRSRPSVARWLVEDGVTMRSAESRGRKRSAPSPIVLAYVTRRSRGGATAPELAKEMLKPEPTVRYWLSLVEVVAQELGGEVSRDGERGC
jgi:hypothetical protein